MDFPPTVLKQGLLSGTQRSDGEKHVGWVAIARTCVLGSNAPSIRLGLFFFADRLRLTVVLLLFAS